jgi:hypothetical protein
MKRAVAKVQTRLLGPLDTAERRQLTELLDKLVSGHQQG